jgi:predicted neuraminidase
MRSRPGGRALEAILLLLAAPLATAGEAPWPIVVSEFIAERSPTPSVHASTVVEARDGLVAAWFGGTDEGRPDVGIWMSRRGEGGWEAPVEVANGVQPDGARHPCWNPVLFQPSRGPLLLFYRVGPSPRAWWGLARTSADGGRTWSEAIRLPPGILGPIRAKPVELPGGAVLAGSSTEHAGWVVHMERWTPGDLASPLAWRKSGPLNDPQEFEAIQPTILAHPGTRLQALCRSRQKVVTVLWSEDGGATWGRMSAAALPNPSAGIDALRLADGRFLLVHNPTTSGRERLEIAASADGKAWRRAALLEDSPGEYSYPAMIQTRDGRVHVTYTWRRERIKHVVLSPAAIE